MENRTKFDLTFNSFIQAPRNVSLPKLFTLGIFGFDQANLVLAWSGNDLLIQLVGSENCGNFNEHIL